MDKFPGFGIVAFWLAAIVSTAACAGRPFTGSFSAAPGGAPALLTIEQNAAGDIEGTYESPDGAAYMVSGQDEGDLAMGILTDEYGEFLVFEAEFVGNDLRFRTYRYDLVGEEVDPGSLRDLVLVATGTPPTAPTGGATTAQSPAPANQPPVLEITEPDLGRGFLSVASRSVRVAGRAMDLDGILSVTANGCEAPLDADGAFRIDVPLGAGETAIVVTATDTRRLATSRMISVFREDETASVDSGAPGERRLALLLGNAAYVHGGDLSNPTNDVDAMGRVLGRLGFTVMSRVNCGQREMKQAIDEFGSRLKSHDVGLFFYAGHGIQVDGSNYLVPVDADLDEESDVEYDCVRADRVLAKMESAGVSTSIVVLDACRDNPFERSWRRSGSGRGLAFMNAPSGSIIAYATAPGSTASDGSGSNGLYTSALLRHIETPGITIEDVFKRVRQTVRDMTDRKQTPWESTSLTGAFFFSR